MYRTFLLFVFIVFVSISLPAQLAYRLNADILTKTRMPDSTYQISNGKIHYDKNYEKIVFDFTFPEKEKIVLFDTLMYHFRGDSLLKTSRNLLIPNQSVFHFIMSGNLSNFGFENAGFEATSIDKENGLVITTWIPPDVIQEHISKVLVATKDKQLYSITLFDANKQVMNRQILKDYQWIDNIEIPHEILIATYTEEGIMYQIITLKNTKLNENGNDNAYNIRL